MDNANKPIYPLQHEGYPSHEKVIENEKIIGLTKREYFAGLAMQGLCVGKITSELKKGECNDIAEMSLLIADELLKQLSHD